MLPDLNKPALAVALMFAALGACPAVADVKAGVDSWSRGDYAVAVREWEGPAAAGDADALFNLGQAYRLGRGVPVDLVRAEDFYARAAASGHLRAADTYGLMLFQDGRREAALPYVEGAARRGDPRAQYLLGIAYFNGDLMARDWVRAYALLTLANGSGLPQAVTAIAEMDSEIPLEQRQQGVSLAAELRNQAEAARASEVAAAELAPNLAASGIPDPAAAPSPRALEAVSAAPSVPAARAALEEATRASGTESPADAGALFAGGVEEPAPVAEPVVVAVLDARDIPPKATPEPERDAAPEPATATASPPKPAATPAATGPWRVQLGAFAVSGNAEKLWSRLSGRTELKGKKRLLIPSGRVTRLLAGGFASRSAADTACRALKRSGEDCLVTQH